MNPATNATVWDCARGTSCTLDWDTFGRGLGRAKDRIVADSFQPEVVVAISRGGLVAATYFANVLNVRDLHILDIRRNTGNERLSCKQEPELLWASPMAQVRGKATLLVDDIVGEGKTMSLAIRTLRERDVGTIRTLVIARFHGSRFNPDYWVFTVNGWVVFPWESSI